MVSQEDSADTGPPSKLLSVTGVFASAKNVAIEAKSHAGRLQKKQDTLENGPLAGRNNAELSYNEEKQTLRKQAETAENNLHNVHLAEAEGVQKLPAERDICSARLHEVVAALHNNFRNYKEMRDKAVDMPRKVEKL